MIKPMRKALLIVTLVVVMALAGAALWGFVGRDGGTRATTAPLAPFTLEARPPLR